MSFTDQKPPPRPEPAPPYRVLRFVASLVTALVITGTSYLCAWRTVGDNWYAEMGPEHTRRYMRELRKGIEQYRARKGHLPASLADLEGNLSEQLPDGWGRPFVYEVAGDTYDLYSLGRDGRPGGSGLDADIRSEVVDSSREHLTLWEFSTHQDIRGVQMSCILAGLLALPIALTSEDKKDLRRTPVGIVLACVAIAVFAVVTGLVMAAVHAVGLPH